MMWFRTDDPNVTMVIADPEEALRHAQAQAIKARIAKARDARADKAMQEDCAANGGHVYGRNSIAWGYGTDSSCLVCRAYKPVETHWLNALPPEPKPKAKRAPQPAKRAKA